MSQPNRRRTSATTTIKAAAQQQQQQNSTAITHQQLTKQKRASIPVVLEPIGQTKSVTSLKEVTKTRTVSTAPTAAPCMVIHPTATSFDTRRSSLDLIRSRRIAESEPDKYELRRIFLSRQVREGRLNPISRSLYNETEKDERIFMTSDYPDWKEVERERRKKEIRRKEQEEEKRKEEEVMVMVNAFAQKRKKSSIRDASDDAENDNHLMVIDAAQITPSPSSSASIHPLLASPFPACSSPLTILISTPSSTSLISHICSYLPSHELLDSLLQVNQHFHHILSHEENHPLWCHLYLDLLSRDREVEERMDKHERVIRARRKQTQQRHTNAWRMRDGYARNVDLPIMSELPLFKPPSDASNPFASLYSTPPASCLDYFICPFTIRSFKQLYLQQSFDMTSQRNSHENDLDCDTQEMTRKLWMNDHARKRIAQVVRTWILWTGRMQQEQHQARSETRASVNQLAVPSLSSISSIASLSSYSITLASSHSAIPSTFSSFLTFLHREYPPMPDSMRMIWKEMYRTEVNEWKKSRASQITTASTEPQHHQQKRQVSSAQQLSSSVSRNSRTTQRTTSSAASQHLASPPLHRPPLADLTSRRTLTTLRHASLPTTHYSPPSSSSSSASLLSMMSCVTSKSTVSSSSSSLSSVTSLLDRAGAQAALSGLLPLSLFRSVLSRMKSVGFHWSCGSDTNIVTHRHRSVEECSQVMEQEWSEIIRVAQWASAIRETQVLSNELTTISSASVVAVRGTTPLTSVNLKRGPIPLIQLTPDSHINYQRWLFAVHQLQSIY